MTEEQILDYIHEWFSLHPNVLVLKEQLKTSNMNSTIKLLNDTISHKKQTIKILEEQKDALVRNISSFQRSIDEGNKEIAVLESDLRRICHEAKPSQDYTQGTMSKASQQVGAALNPNRIRDIFSNEPV